MKINIVSLSLLFVSILFSCQKEEYEIDEKTEEPRLIKVKIANQPFYEYSYISPDIVREEKSTYHFIDYSYNDLGQMVTVDYYSDSALLSEDLQVLENALNNEGLLNIADSEIEGFLEYKYDVYGMLKNSYFVQSSGSSNEYSKFTYDVNGRISRQTLFWDNKIAGYIDYLYDSAGNLIKETVYSATSDGDPELSTTTQYEFDSYKNPFKTFYRLMIPGINTNTNNIVKETFTIHFKPGQGTDIVQTTITSYDYNSWGYPVRKNGNIEYLYE